MFGTVASDFAFEEHSARVERESTDGFADYFMGNFPVMVTAQRMLGDRFAEMRRAIVDIWNDAHQTTDGTQSPIRIV
jgi:hypothetical protein